MLVESGSVDPRDFATSLGVSDHAVRVLLRSLREEGMIQLGRRGKWIPATQAAKSNPLSSGYNPPNSREDPPPRPTRTKVAISITIDGDVLRTLDNSLRAAQSKELAKGRFTSNRSSLIEKILRDWVDGQD